MVPATITSHTWTVEAPPPCTMSQATLGANADSWIDQSSPDANKGTDSELKVMSKGPANNIRALVRFTHPALANGCVVTDAKLRLHAGSAAGGRTIEALRVTGGWSESAVTWNNQPRDRRRGRDRLVGDRLPRVDRHLAGARDVRGRQPRAS